MLFEPKHMRVVPYCAGCENALVWASSEEGRSIVPTSYHSALEKKMLAHAKNLEFEEEAKVRDRLVDLRRKVFGVEAAEF